MAEKLTQQQQMAVTDRGGKLLISAAAGSGKTKVLVDRLLSYLTDPIQPCNIDEFLIITYTKAAAAELRGKIGAKLTEKIAEDPTNKHLQMQMQKLYLTKISTVHAYCTDILREYVHKMDIAVDFRVADETECLELQCAAMDQVLNDAYEHAGNMPDFCALVDTQGLGRDDRQIPEIVFKIYNSARCHLNPEQWLDLCLDAFCIDGITDAAETVWGAYLMEDLKSYLKLHITAMERCAECALSADGMEKPAGLIQETVEQLKRLESSSSWDAVRQNAAVDFGRLTFPRKCSDPVLAERIKAVRSACKKGLEKKLRRFCDSSEQILLDLSASAAAARGLVELVRRYGAAYDRLKRARRILDFGDLEHKTLDLLLGKSRSGATAAARELAARYQEVMVDEYQDSNEVQDAIFSVLTQKRGNCFMVGDVKQSIYQFRLADPGIFLEKYNTFLPAEDAKPGEGRKIQLSHNFRSASAVISAVNDVFALCMSEHVGGLKYGEDEALHEGIAHIPLDDPEIELYGISVREDTYEEEAAVVADRISALLDGKQSIRQGDAAREIKAEDIVILLRSPGSVGKSFQRALEMRGISCSMGSNADLLQTEEVATLRAILEIIHNPLQDIPLLTALTSRVFGFTADDLAMLRGGNRSVSMYASLCSWTHEKATGFLQILTKLRKEARMGNLSTLLEHIFHLTRIDSIYASMADGVERVENLQTFLQIAAAYDMSNPCDLGGFLKHLKTLDAQGTPISGDPSAAGAVTIMSIHKSKGLEFPVVFLCGLSREFNRESARAQVLSDKTLGIGLSCVDTANRVRYPSLAKRAIAAKMIAEGLSEEMRVLYVAMTRAKDRLIMTYASNRLEGELSEIALRMDMSPMELLTEDVDCPGKWILLTALSKTEAGAFFSLGGQTICRRPSEHPWLIQIAKAGQPHGYYHEDVLQPMSLDRNTTQRLREGLSFRYPYQSATQLPSKLTATQLKGRYKDQEVSEQAPNSERRSANFRKPSFADNGVQGKVYGNAIHAVMQYIPYSACKSVPQIDDALLRLTEQGYISTQMRQYADSKKIWAFFQTEIGQKLMREDANVLREFKFSVLDDTGRYTDGISGEQILLQGVVDCALIENDGITVVDFKTDFVTASTLQLKNDVYRAQVEIYAQALSRIYKLPVKEKLIYYFHMDKLVTL